MKTAIVTTTINVPTVLALYRKIDPSVAIFVAADLKTPAEAHEFCNEIDNCFYLSAHEQERRGYKHSELIGWNTDSRRNIALLEALKWGADLIISIDDDMIPDLPDFRFWEGMTFRNPFSGLQVGSPKRWINTGYFTVPQTLSRGLPVDRPPMGVASFDAVVDATIGVAQGIILGVPDSDAISAINDRPFVTGVSDILRNGFVVDPKAYTVFNSQITAFRRELAPAFAQFYKWQGRNTDIFASVLMRRLMQGLNWYTYFGPPMGFHARKARPLLPDLKAELFGLENIVEFNDYLQRAPLSSIIAAKSDTHWVLNNCWTLMEGCALWSIECKEAMAAFYEDCEAVL